MNTCQFLLMLTGVYYLTSLLFRLIDFVERTE